MLPISLPVQPSVDTQRTPLQVGRGMVASNLIRHRAGSIEKLGGCSRLTNLTFTGICRCLFPWQDLRGNHYLAIGTNQGLQLFSDNQMRSIAAIKATSNLAGSAFVTQAGLQWVEITDAAATVVIGSWIEIGNMALIDGFLLQGLYQVIGVSGHTFLIDPGRPAQSSNVGAGTQAFDTNAGYPNVLIHLAPSYQTGSSVYVAVSTTVGGITIAPGSYQITLITGVPFNFGPTINPTSSNATSTATAQENGGNIQVNYLAPLPQDGLGQVPGPPGTTTGGGYGQGPYGVGAYGVGQLTIVGGGPPTPPGSLQGAFPGVIFALEWSMDKWGQNLVFCWITSAIYQWIPPVSAGNVSQPVGGTSPAQVSGLFVAAPQQQTMAWGISSAVLGGAQDPMLVGWCDVANLPVWNALTTNQAGSFRLSSGNLIVSGTWFGTVGLLWTDIDLWAMVFVGFPLVYGFNKVAPNCGLLARRAWAIMGTLCCWMSQNDFFVYQGGQVSPLPCSVHDFVFRTLDTTHAEEIHADANTYNDEITWWFPQIGSNGQCTGAVKFHAIGGEWDITSSGLSISAWCDQSVLGQPIGAFYTGHIERFETAVDFDGQLLDSFIISGFFQIAEGEEMFYVDRAYPDFNISPDGGQLAWTFFFADSMGDAAAGNVRQYGPYVVTPLTPYIVIRGRGRVMQHRIDCNLTANTFYRVGESLIQVSIDGRR